MLHFQIKKLIIYAYIPTNFPWLSEWFHNWIISKCKNWNCMVIFRLISCVIRVIWKSKKILVLEKHAQHTLITKSELLFQIKKLRMYAQIRTNFPWSSDWFFNWHELCLIGETYLTYPNKRIGVTFTNLKSWKFMLIFRPIFPSYQSDFRVEKKCVILGKHGQYILITESVLHLQIKKLKIYVCIPTNFPGLSEWF